jgi:hypothetical protein
MRRTWRETSFRNKNKDFNFLLTKNSFNVNLTSNVVNSEFILAQTISAENITFKDLSFNNLSIDTLAIDNINTNNLFAFNTNATNIEAIEISSNNLYATDVSCTNIFSENFTVKNLILDNLDVSNLFVETITANNITSSGDIITDITSLNNQYNINVIQDNSINILGQSIVHANNRNVIQDNSINILDVSINNSINRNNAQDNSINILDASFVYLKQLNKTQDVSINIIMDSDLSTISTETLTGPGDTTINGNISNTILQGSFSSTIDLQNGTTNNFIKQITNISSSTPITINGLFTENGLVIVSREIDYRIKLIWNGSRWIVLDDNYFVNNGDGSIYTFRNIGINTASPQYNLDVAGSIRCRTLIQTSDARVKENIDVIDNALNKVLQLRGVYFNYINHPIQREIGFIAQEVEPIFPELIVTSEIDGIKSLKYLNVVAILVEAIKELKYKYYRLLDDYNKLYSKLNL